MSSIKTIAFITRVHPKRPGMLKVCIDSVKAQTNDDYVHILHRDDGTENGYGIIMAERSLLSVPPINAKYVMILDDDDMLIDPDFVETFKKIVSEDDLEIVFFKGIIVGKEGLYPQEEVWGRSPLRNRIAGFCFAVRLDIWKKYVSIFVDMRTGGDFRFISACYANTKNHFWLDRVVAKTQKGAGKGRGEHDIPKNIEVCLMIYQRPHRLPEILEQLKAQTIQSFKVNIWNNSNEKLDVSNFPEDRIKVIDSKENIGSQARWRLAKQTTGNPIIFFDDDEELEQDFVGYHYEQYLKFGSKCILGWSIKVFHRERYWKYKGANYGQEVDYVGSGGMIMDRELFDKELLSQNIPEPFKETEDLYLGYLARMKYGMKLIKIESKCKILVDGKDQFKGIDKEKIFRELRAKGWRLLKDE